MIFQATKSGPKLRRKKRGKRGGKSREACEAYLVKNMVEVLLA
jgi:hypothetical protein